MNIVTPVPTAVIFPTANISTEAARRDNLQRDTIPQTSGAENSAAESGIGSESDRVRTPGQQPQVTYERPPQQSASSSSQNPSEQSVDQDNGQDPSAGRESAEQRQQEQQQASEQREVQQLRERDREVRAHEQAHAAVGGQYAGSPSYEFESGPDGRQYAVGGQVSIDISEESTAQETIRKMQQVRAAALAPADPSPQDLRVASEATQIASEARAEVARENAEEAKSAVANNIEQQLGDVQALPGQAGGQNNPNEALGGSETGQQNERPDLDDIIDGIETTPPTRALDRASLDIDDAAVNTEPLARSDIDTAVSATDGIPLERDASILRRVSVIEGFYQNVSRPRQFDVQQRA